MKIIRKFICEFTEQEKKEIDTFIELNEGLVFHETKFNEIASEVFNTNMFYFIAHQDDKTIGICPVHVLKQGTLKFLCSSLSSNEIPYGGWIFDRQCTSIKELLHRTKLHWNESLMYWSAIQANCNDYEELENIKVVRYSTVLLPLACPQEDIFNMTLCKKQRNKIRRARKLGVLVESIPYDNIDSFINLSSELKQQIGLPYGSPEFYKKIVKGYNGENKIVCLAAKLNNQYISSMILIANKNYTIAWVAGRKTNIPNNLYQNELLIWESIVWAKQFGSKWFDLCGLDELNLPHLARIKLSFSKEIVPFYYFTKKSSLYRVLNRIQNVFNN